MVIDVVMAVAVSVTRVAVIVTVLWVLSVEVDVVRELAV